MKDVFMCHASEDKDGVVLPIVGAFENSGISYWLDRAEITWGDSLIEKINDGLASSRYVIVVLSESFLSKRWPQRELNSVLNIEASTGCVKVLPLMVGDAEKIVEKFVLLNDKTYIRWNGDPSEVVEALKCRLKKEAGEAPQADTLSRNRNIPLPKVKRNVTQREKDLFLKRVFGEILLYFKDALSRLESHHEGIEADLDEIHKFKFVCKIYLDGEVRNECKIWLGGPFGNAVSYVQGRHIDINNDSSFNDWLSVEDDGSDVFLKSSDMQGYGDQSDQRLLSGADAGEYFWRRVIASLEQ